MVVDGPVRRQVVAVGPPAATNGELLIDLAGNVTSDVWFRVPAGTDANSSAISLLSEFSVASITPAPEPATLMLLGRASPAWVGSRAVG